MSFNLLRAGLGPLYQGRQAAHSMLRRNRKAASKPGLQCMEHPSSYTCEMHHLCCCMHDWQPSQQELTPSGAFVSSGTALCTVRTEVTAAAACQGCAEPCGGLGRRMRPAP